MLQAIANVWQMKKGPKALGWSQKQQAEREHFGKAHLGAANCDLVKYTSCRDGACAVKKTVKCKSWCRWAGWKKGRHTYKNCEARFCKGYWRVKSSGVTEKVSESSMIALMARRDKMQLGSPDRHALEAEITLLKKHSFGNLLCNQAAMMA